MIEKAILKINPNASFTVSNNDINSIQWLNNTAPISVADIQAQIPVVEQELADKKQAKIDAQVSGNQKLLDLGLTQAEATALTGYTPPVAE